MTEPRIERIPLNRTRANPNQPRKSFDEGELQELAKSLRGKRGLRSPISVRRINEPNCDFEIVAGERRFRAACINRDHYRGPTTIKAIVEDLDDDEMAVDAIVENLQRVGVNPADEAAAFQRLIDHHRYTAEQIASEVGIELWRVNERLALVKLDDEVRSLVRSGQLAPTCGVEIAKLPKEQHTKIARRIAAGQLSTIAEIRAAVNTLIEQAAQGEMLGATPKASRAELVTVGAMEKKIAQIKGLAASGFKNGEVVAAKKVAPDRARKMADELEVVRLSISRMVKDLRQAAVQHEMSA